MIRLDAYGPESMRQDVQGSSADTYIEAVAEARQVLARNPQLRAIVIREPGHQPIVLDRMSLALVS